MPVEAIAEAQCLLEIDRAFAVETDGPVEALARDIERERGTVDRHHRHARAGDGDAVPERDAREVERTGVDVETDARAGI